MSVDSKQKSVWRFCIAPMMDWTDRHCRYLLRLLFPQARLYTEMVTTGALIHGDAQRFLAYDPSEHPLAIQLGGSHAGDMAVCAKMAEDHGYDEVNINVGCPSDRVQSGAFGACLMRQPERVADCIAAMQNKVEIPVTVKTRIGVDEQDENQCLPEFLNIISQAGCGTVIIHARKAWLQGLSPKENRDVPPLNYDLVYRMRREFPRLNIIVNGGINTSADIEKHLELTDGVMIGRQAYQNPYVLREAYQSIFPSLSDQDRLLNPREVVYAYLPYIKRQLSQNVPLRHMTRHMLGLFCGRPGAKQWRRLLTELHDQADDQEGLILKALQQVVIES